MALVALNNYNVPNSDTLTISLLENHLSNGLKSRYKNMHLRQHKQINSKTTLRYLHIVKILETNKIGGHVSGPSLEVEYELFTGANPRIRVLNVKGNLKEANRFFDRIWDELKDKIAEEQVANTFPPKYAPKRFYLKRGIPGSKSTSRNCKEAITQGMLSQEFLNKLRGWGFFLIYKPN